MNWRWIVLLLAGMAARLNAAPAAQPPHFVFAHYMVCCTRLENIEPSPDQLADEIALARKYGIDGFALNIGGWDREPYYRRVADKLFVAARRFPGFKLFLSTDNVTSDEATAMLARYAGDPAYLRVDGRPFLSTFSSNPKWDKTFTQAVAAAHLTMTFVPHEFPNTGGNPELPSASTFAAQYATPPKPAGYFYFGAAGPWQKLAAANRDGAAAAKAAGLYYMASVSAYYRGTRGNNRVFDNGGFMAMAAQWRAAIEGGANFVEIVTWNDWGESTYVRPFGDDRVRPRQDRVALLAHDAFLEASRPYIQWFHTGLPPPVAADRVHVFYRPHRAADCDARWPFAQLPCPDHVESLADRLYLVIEARRPTRLIVRSGRQRTVLSVPTGRTSRDLPLSDGPLSILAISNGVRRGWTSPIGYGSGNRTFQHAMMAWSF